MVGERASIQGIVDGLADRLSRATAIDDPAFRLLFHSPQRGPLDDVRVRSILDRDAPVAAKQWVREQGVAAASGVDRLPGAPQVGMLPRTYAPIRHEGQLLGYLWVIDPDGSLDEDDDDEIAQASREVAPLLYRRRVRDVLDRHHQRAAVLDLLDQSVAVREAAARRLRDGAAVRPGGEIVALVVDIVVPRDAGYSTADLVALEDGLGRARARTPGFDVLHVTDGPRGVVVLSRPPGGAGDARVVAETIHADLTSALRGHRVVVGIGSTRGDLREARDSYDEAVVAARVLGRVAREGDVAHHDDLGPYAVVARLPDGELGRPLVPVALRRLLAAGEDELVATLVAFLDNAGDVAATAAELHLHRSSVYGRLRRIEEVTGRSLGDGRARLELHLGLAVARYVEAWPSLARDA